MARIVREREATVRRGANAIWPRDGRLTRCPPPWTPFADDRGGHGRTVGGWAPPTAELRLRAHCGRFQRLVDYWAEHTGLRVSDETVRRALKHAGIGSAAPTIRSAVRNPGLCANKKRLTTPAIS